MWVHPKASVITYLGGLFFYHWNLSHPCLFNWNQFHDESAGGTQQMWKRRVGPCHLFNSWFFLDYYSLKHCRDSFQFWVRKRQITIILFISFLFKKCEDGMDTHYQEIKKFFWVRPILWFLSENSRAVLLIVLKDASLCVFLLLFDINKRKTKQSKDRSSGYTRRHDESWLLQQYTLHKLIFLLTSLLACLLIQASLIPFSKIQIRCQLPQTVKWDLLYLSLMWHCRWVTHWIPMWAVSILVIGPIDWMVLMVSSH